MNLSISACGFAEVYVSVMEIQRRISDNILEKLNAVAYTKELGLIKRGSYDGIVDEEKAAETTAAQPNKDSEQKPVVKYKKPGTEIKPDYIFYYHGQLVRVVDNNTLSLVYSETGALGIDRVVSAIETEWDIRKKNYIDSASIDSVSDEEIDKLFSPPSRNSWHRSEKIGYILDDFREVVAPKLGSPKYLKFNIICQELLLRPTTICIVPGGTIIYNPEEILDDTILPDLLLGAIGFMYNQYEQHEEKPASVQ